MPNIDDPKIPTPPIAMADSLKSWVMISLTLIFVLLYAAAFIFPTHFESTTAIKELQPIIFVIIGYYFGRLPAQQTEDSLNREIDRQATKTDAAISAKGIALKNEASMEKKMEDAKTVLSSVRAGPREDSELLKRICVVQRATVV
ncbi:MAG TPA: hypothetical protein VGO50_02435 [Pyrinomonadaceae bacterium]|jgi:hypothetical protein|nr:hypothetical protein [Pyrinomonadaceae bacterium]